MRADPPSTLAHLREAALSLGDLAWPRICAGCGAWGASLCVACRGVLGQAQPMACRPLWLPEDDVYAALRFEGPVREILSAYKDEGRRDMRAHLVPVLRASMSAALLAWRASPSGQTSGITSWQMTCAPSSRSSLRGRGWFPLGELSQAAARPALPFTRLLETTRPVADQSGLNRRERRENLRDAVRVRAPAQFSRDVGERTGLVVIDDVVTSGASLCAAQEALRQVMDGPILFAVIARTPLHE